MHWKARFHTKILFSIYPAIKAGFAAPAEYCAEFRRAQIHLQQHTARILHQSRLLLLFPCPRETLNWKLMCERAMTDPAPDLLEAIPVFKLICPESGELVGVEYHWNNGEIGVLWRGAPLNNLVRHPFQDSEPRNTKNPDHSSLGENT